VVVGKPVVVVVRRIVVVVVNCPSRCEIVVVTALRATVVVGNALPGFLVTVVTTNTVVVELTTVVDVLSTEVLDTDAGTITGAIGVTANMLDAAPCPTMLVARTITWYSMPFASPPMLSGDVIEPVGQAVQVTPLSNEYSWLRSDEPPLLPSAKLAEMAPSLAVSELSVGAKGTTGLMTNERVTSGAAL
jgi:hypothetical protein